MLLSDKLFAKGVFAQGIAFPTVASDKARVRTIVTATHTREDLQFALDAFAAVGPGIGLDLQDTGRATPTEAAAAGNAGHWFDAWTRDVARDVTAEDLQRLFTHDTREAYRFFSRGLDEERLANEPWWRRQLLRVRQVFIAFTLKLSPARRAALPDRA